MYKIKLQHFEGPLDLLLFFIKRDELDIYDIPISYITKEFISYMHFIKSLDLETAGDFILMASTLMQIKVRMLLPKEVDEEGEEIDPRSDLVASLLEYKQYKEMAEEMNIMESRQRSLSFRSYFAEDSVEKPPELDSMLRNITVYDLIKAFKKVLDNKPKEVFHEIKRINVSIDEQINYLIDATKNNRQVTFGSLIGQMKEKLRIIVTFIAMLELVKMGKIGLVESEGMDEFSIYGIENG